MIFLWRSTVLDPAAIQLSDGEKLFPKGIMKYVFLYLTLTGTNLKYAFTYFK
jgi:hypothetical protein